MRLARVLGAIGRILITLGVLILLFVVYQLWGTGIREAPAEGDATARIRIPDIGVDKIVVEGVTLDDLKRGPGHYPETPLPGQPGNAAIAGHRTTYGAPFGRINELEPGDEILVTTLQGAFRYEMSEQLIVEPDQVEVLEDFGDNRLTLTACHPKYSARQRIIVVATLVGEVAPAPEPAPDPEPVPAPATGEIPGEGGENGEGAGEEPTTASIDGGLSGERAPAWPAIALGFACACIWLAAWLLGKLWQAWPAYLLCLPLFLLMLFFFFENFSRLLPANF